MKLRSSLVLAPVLAALSIGTVAPAHAAVTDPVTNLQVSVVQAPGSHDSWKVTATWDAVPDVRTYDVVIADREDGTVTSGKAYGNQDTALTSVSITTSRLVEDHDYWVAVRPFDTPDGTLAEATFHTVALDTTAPAGRFRLDRTSAYLESDLLSEDVEAASFQITQTALDAGATRKVLAGDGTPAKAWTRGTGFTLTYTRVGTFTPHVLLTDEFANTRDIALPAVHVLDDSVAPTIRITTPARPGRIASWRRIHGTATDAGTGVAMVGVFVMEKRGATWWAYDFDKRAWLKGTTSRRQTEAKTEASAAMASPAASGAWRSPAVRGIQKGTLLVQAVAFDNEFNIAVAHPVGHRVH